MTINNLKAFINGLWDWGILNGCFGNTRIRLSDLDGIAERNGKFLVVEAKSPGKEIPMGQMIMYKHLVDLGCFTVILVWGEKNAPERMTIMTSGMTKVFENSNLDDLRKVVSTWFDYANASGNMFWVNKT